MTEFLDGQSKTFATLDNAGRRDLFAGIDAGGVPGAMVDVAGGSSSGAAALAAGCC